MSEEQKAVEPELVEAMSGDLDWFLQGFIDLANKGLQFPITLISGGMLVSGIMIGGEEYFRLYGEMMRLAFSGEDTQAAMQQWVATFGERYLSSDEEESDRESGRPSYPPQFIHMKNAKYFTPGERPIPGSGDGTLWRGRLSQVTGFNYGSLATD